MTWMPFAIAFLLTVGVEGVVMKLALRSTDWSNILLWTLVWYGVITLGIVTTGRLDTHWSWPTSFFASVSGLCAVGGLLFLALALERGAASLVVPFSAGYPLVTVLLAVVILGERVTPSRVIGLLLVVVGLLLLGRSA